MNTTENPTQTTDKPRELPLGVLHLMAAKRADGYPTPAPHGLTKTERDALRGTVVYHARENTRGDHRDGTSRKVVDVARYELVKVGPTWTTYNDLDYEFARHELKTDELVRLLSLGNLVGWHRTEADLDAAVAEEAEYREAMEAEQFADEHKAGI